MHYSPRKVSHLERECLKAANRTMQRSGSLTEDEFLKLRVQTCTPLERFIVVLCGLGLGGLALWLHFGRGESVWSLVTATIAVGMIVVGFMGRPMVVGVLFRGLDGAVSQGILDALF